jgi:hypothetical protein
MLLHSTDCLLSAAAAAEESTLQVKAAAAAVAVVVVVVVLAVAEHLVKATLVGIGAASESRPTRPGAAEGRLRLAGMRRRVRNREPAETEQRQVLLVLLLPMLAAARVDFIPRPLLARVAGMVAAETVGEIRPTGCPVLTV